MFEAYARGPGVLLKLFLLFIVVPLVELTLLLILGDYTVWYVPIAVVIVTGVVGASLARQQGFQTYRKIQQELAHGQIPTDSLLDALMILVAGALLLTPGLLTDALGMSLLMPICRVLYKRRLVDWFKTRFTINSFSTTSDQPARSQVIDSYVVDPPETDNE